MDYGLCLPNFPAGASREGIESAADVAAGLGLSTVWTTDHVLVPKDSADEYGHIYEAILTLAWVGDVSHRSSSGPASSWSRNATRSCWPRSWPRSMR